MREVAKRGGIDSPLAVDGIAVTAAWFAVLGAAGSVLAGGPFEPEIRVVTGFPHRRVR
jgi:hypothetical protein